MSSSKRMCIVLLIGIPGSGKSYFRIFLERFLGGNLESVLGSVQMCTLCFDNYYKVRNPNQNCSWKNERLSLINMVEDMIVYLKENNFKAIDVSKFSVKFPGVCLINESEKEPDSNIILIDDNMYYRSMRYDYYKLAKAHNISFSQVYFKIGLEEALNCNNVRIEAQVPISVIKTMYSKIEPPNTKHYWEVNSVSIQSYSNFQNNQILNKIFSCLTRALEKPIVCSELELDKKKGSKHGTNSNALHQIDNALKQVVNSYIKTKINECNKSELIAKSKFFSKKRLDLLKQIREGNIDLNVNLNSPISVESMDCIKPLLSVLLLEQL